MICGQQECEQIQTLHVFFKHLAEITMVRMIGTEALNPLLVGTKHESPDLSAKICEQRNGYGTFASSSVAHCTDTLFAS
jgi:hypothetical protein